MPNVTGTAATEMCSGVKRHFEIGTFGVSVTFGEVGRCQMNRDPEGAVKLDLSTNFKFVLRSWLVVFIKHKNSNRKQF